MSVTITIQGTPISFPSSSESPNWAPNVIAFAQAVETALSASVGPYDVASQVLTIDSYNPGSPSVNIPNLTFSTSNVRAAHIKYSVFRTTSTTTAYEVGNIIIIYNPNGSVGSKWEMSNDKVGDGKISFYVTDTGQVQFTAATPGLGGLSHAGKLSYSATALLQS